jgi:predicted nuclease with TOPRIM domain
VTADELSKVKQEKVNLHEELSILKDEHSKLSERFEKMGRTLSDLESGKGILGLLLKVSEKNPELTPSPECEAKVPRIDRHTSPGSHFG